MPKNNKSNNNNNDNDDKKAVDWLYPEFAKAVCSTGVIIDFPQV